MACHILIWFVVTVRTTSIDLFTAPAFFLFFQSVANSKKIFFWYAYTYRYLLIFKNAFIIATAQAIRTLIAVRQKLFIFYDF